MTPRARIRILVPLAAGVAALACATAPPVRYTPSLAAVNVPHGDGGAPVSALIAIVGPVAGRDGKRIGIEVRMRFENHGEQPVAVEPERIELVTADLQSLGPPELLPAGAVDVAPGGQATVSAVFKYAPENEPNG